MDTRDGVEARRPGSSSARTLGIGLCALMLAALGGCQREGVPDAPAAGTPSSPRPDVPAPAPRPGDAPGPVEAADLPTPTVAASSADATRVADEPPILRAVRIGEHAGHDRVVFEFDGEGLPAWRVEYVDRPVTDCGAGHAVPVAGGAWLQVRFSGAHAHTPAGVPTSGPARRSANHPALRELVRTCDFEAEVTWVAGLASATPYTPRVLSAPARLVIDIAH